MNKIIRFSEASRVLNKSRGSMYRDIKNRLLPPPFSLGQRSVGWPESEILLIQTARIAGKSDAEIRTLVLDLITARVSQYESLAKGVSHD